MLSRPLHLPVLRPDQPCPTSHGTPINAVGFVGVALGVGPVHPLAGDTNGVAELTSRTQHPGWLAIKDLWFSEPGYQGPFLVRIRRLDGAGPAGLLENPALTSFYVPPGPTSTGTDGYREVTGATWVTAPGCLAWQVDGLTFSNVIVIRLVCQPPTCALPHTAASTAQAAEAAHLRWFIGAYDAGDIRTALAQFSARQNVGFSDCDYARHAVVDGHGRAALTAWLRRNIAQHDRLVIDTISDANPSQSVGALGVTFSRRSNDVLAGAGRPAGITPTTAAKVKFDSAGLITEFNNGPYGGSAASCRVP